jgi:hypothetical protein
MQNWQLKHKVTTTEIPGGSSLEVLNNNLIVIGDDAKYIGVFNSEYLLIHKEQLWDSETDSIEKKLKADLEASFILNKNNKEILHIVGSGSKGKKRDWLIELSENNGAYEVKKTKEPLYYEALKKTTDDKVNIEAAECINDIVWLGNRGHKAEPTNHFLGFNVSEFPNSEFVNANLKINIPQQDIPYGISGLYLHKQSNIVYASFSSEDIDNAYDDGAIGPSALATFNANDFKVQNTEITPMSFIVLETVFKELKGQKIEAICIFNNQMVLVADNDDQKTTLWVYEAV